MTNNAEIDINTNQKSSLFVKIGGLKGAIKYSLIAIGIIILWLMIVQYINAYKYDAIVSVKNTTVIGVNPSTNQLDFGELPPGGAAIRYVEIVNEGDMQVYIKVLKIGSIAELIKSKNETYLLSQGEKRKMEFMLNIPSNAEEREYKGKVYIFRIPKVF